MTEAAQLDAILHGAAFAPLTDRAFLRVTGADATRWLNGMVTNNIAALAPGEGNYNFLLNAQGRIQGDCTIYREPGDDEPTYILETDKDQIDLIEKLLEKFIIMDDVQIAQSLSIWGPMTERSGWGAMQGRLGLRFIGKNAPEILLKVISTRSERPLSVAPEPGTLSYAIANWEQGPVSVFHLPNAQVPTYDIWFTDADQLESVEVMSIRNGAIKISPATLEAYRIYSGTPKFGIDIRDRDLPQETGQTHALHFSKGCYLGQEIVERIRSRGQVHRQFTQFKLTGSLPKLPATLEANGKPAGELTSAAQIGDTIYALGYARREALDTHQPLSYPGGTALATGKLATGN